MDLIRLSINKPVTILSVVIIVVLFGIISLFRLPYQLSPTVVKPEITVKTIWRGAAPYEVEREIIEEQENTLKGITGLEEMESESANGMGTITLLFKIGTKVDEALLRVSNKINEVPNYPEGVDNPIITSSGSATSPVIWAILKTKPENRRDIYTYLTYFENEIRQHIERVNGVSDLFVGAGTVEEMHVIVRQEDLAAHKVTVNDIIRVLRSENINTSAGTLGLGRRDYRIRTTGEFESIQDIENLVIRSNGQNRVLLSDVASVKPGYAKQTSVVFHNGKTGIAVGIKPEPGTNILEMTDLVQKVVDRLNKDQLNPQGLELEWVYDQRFYIAGAISLIKKNILYGGILAVVVLLLFLRSLRATLVVATSIPISIIGTFVFLDLLGRNLNVVSLAGIAFAVGMLVDNAIVVIENIDRHRKMGKNATKAAYEGSKEVWGAVLASTLTTVAVFLPVVFIQEEAGQLFRDIAIAVVAAVSISLFVSVSVIPMFCSKIFNRDFTLKPQGIGILGSIGNLASALLMALVKTATRNWLTRTLTVTVLISLAIFSVKILMPKMEYLPQGNRNFVLSILIPPPGLSNSERIGIGEHIFKIADPHLGKDQGGIPAIKNMFYVGSEGFMIVGAMSKYWDRARELLPLFRNMVFSIPGMFGVSMQAGIFQSGIGEGRTVNLDLSGNDLDAIVKATGIMFGKTREVIAGAQVRPVPSIEMTYPEVNIIPERDRLRASGMSAGDLGIIVDVMMDGRIVAEFKQEGKKKIDLVVKTSADQILTPEDLFQALVVTSDNQTIPISSLARLEKTVGMSKIRHLERKRTITLQITPPEDLPLQSAMEIIEEKVISPVRDMGLLKNIEVRMSGAADKLTETRKALQWNFVLAAVIAYLLMASLFGNFIYPLIILLTVPLASAGGFLGLKLLNLFIVQQSMDILTMLGFVILIGVVVNNAILIVHQALNNFHEHGMEHQEAVIESTKSRLRPIYMSATTSVFGMLPLVIMPGAGSELYRGLGSVILGGIAISTIFTVFIIPAILMFVIKMEKRKNADPQNV